MNINTVCSNVPCLQTKYFSKILPGRPPIGPGGSVYRPIAPSTGKSVQNIHPLNDNSDYGVFHFGSKPYLEITAPFLTILGQTFDMSKFRISNDPSAPKNYFKNYKYDRNMRLFTGSITLDKIKMIFEVTFSIDFERIDKLKLQVSEG